MKPNILDISNPDVNAQMDSLATKTLGALNDAITVDTTGKSTLGIQLFGAFSGTVTVQVSVDGTNYVALTGSPLINVNSGVYATAITAAGVYQADVAGFSSAKVIVTAYTSGTPTLAVRATDVDGMIALDAMLPAGTNTIGAVTANTPAGTTYSVVTTAAVLLANAKASAGNLFELTVSNPTATAAYVKLYNKATAPIVASDVPVLTIPVPAGAAGLGLVALNFGQIGKRFATGISIAVTGAAAATDSTVPVAGIQINGTLI